MEYTINKAAEILGLSTYTLRYYEKEGLLLNIKRNDNGRRCYLDGDIEWVEFIKCLRDTGMSISDIKYLIELINTGDSTIDKRKEILREHKNKLEDKMRVLKNSINKIEKKIQWYDGDIRGCGCNKGK